MTEAKANDRGLASPLKGIDASRPSFCILGRLQRLSSGFWAAGRSIPLSWPVRELICAVEQVSGLAVPVKKSPRRPGDPAVLIADAGKIHRELHWSPRYTDIRPIVETAWNWHRSHPIGFRKVCELLSDWATDTPNLCLGPQAAVGARDWCD